MLHMYIVYIFSIMDADVKCCGVRVYVDRVLQRVTFATNANTCCNVLPGLDLRRNDVENRGVGGWWRRAAGVAPHSPRPYWLRRRRGIFEIFEKSL